MKKAKGPGLKGESLDIDADALRSRRSVQKANLQGGKKGGGRTGMMGRTAFDRARAMSKNNSLGSAGEMDTYVVEMRGKLDGKEVTFPYRIGVPKGAEIEGLDAYTEEEYNKE